MKEKINKQEKGITLIALVITIIVLLILAGVAISMLSGENGILTRASEAKEKTEIAQKEEEINLASMDLETYFITNNLKYKCAYGYVTGIDIGEEVSELQTALQAGGYELKAKDKTDNFTEKNDNGKYIITTNMAIVKNDIEVARTVIFGDVDRNGMITQSDCSFYVNGDIGKVAGDVNHDGILDWNDEDGIQDWLVGQFDINQYVYAMNPSKLILKDEDSIKKNYVELLSKNFTIKNTTWNYNNEEISGDAITNIPEGTTVKDILDLLPEEAAIYRRSTKKVFKRDSGSEAVQTNDRIIVIKEEVVDEDTNEIVYMKLNIDLYIVK